MSSAIAALRAAIQAHLQADSGLIDLLGPGRIHDEAPRAARGVYVVHGEVEAQDWSTGGDSGVEQQIALVVWADDSASSKRALQAAGLVVAALDHADLALAGHRLINLTWRSSRLARDAQTNLASVTLRFRAVTETL